MTIFKIPQWIPTFRVKRKVLTKALKTLYNLYYNPSPTFSKFIGYTCAQGSSVFKTAWLRYKLSKLNCDLTNAEHSRWGRIVKSQENSLASGMGKLRQTAYSNWPQAAPWLTCLLHPWRATPLSIKPSAQWGSDQHQIILATKPLICWPQLQSFGQTRDNI
jgi:hypothetical protein